jgi:UDP-N-acetylmuramoyl-L-alanine---L-glutamate ligase
VRFSELDGARIGVWGAGREVRSFADQLARRLPSARILVAAFDSSPASDVRDALRAPDVRIVTAARDRRRDSEGTGKDGRDGEDGRGGEGGRDSGEGVDDGGEGVDDGGEGEHNGSDALVAALAGCDVVVRSPGVSIHRAELRAVRERGTPVTTATALWLAERGGAGVIGVTGTKGKSTTAALACHLARAAGRTAELAGNIGVPALELLDREPADVTVVELSSYHTADLEIGPEVALVTSLFREHTDWHGSEEAYRADKLRLLALRGVRVAVVNGRDERLAEALPVGQRPAGSAAVVGVETIRYGVPDGWNVLNGGVALRGEPRAAGAGLPLRGEHNALNLCGAVTALEALGVAPPSPLSTALEGFRPLAHRLETVAERDGITWVNDSISTTPESTLAALASFPGRQIVLIAGGQDRGQDYRELARALAATGASVIGVPSTGPRLLAAARAAGMPAARTFVAADLDQAVAHARSKAQAGAVVLLSPAAPSYDNYRDFEQRGDRFRALADPRGRGAG